MDAVDPFAVDVVIPVRNGARYLARCLDSLMAQTRPVRSAIVVDDGSTDATPDILADYRRRWPELAVVRIEPSGLAHARNVGIRMCCAPFVAFLDSDDVWVERKLERQMELFARSDPGIGFVHCGYYSIDAEGNVIQLEEIVPCRRDDPFRALLIEGNVVSGSASAVIVRRSLLERVGGFDESLSFGEDWDLWLRLAELSGLDFVSDALVAIRVHDDSMQHQKTRDKMKVRMFQRLNVLDRWYAIGKLPVQVREQFRADAVNIAIDEIWRRPLSGWRYAWRLQAELKQSRTRLGRELFSGPMDFFGPFPFRIARAVLRPLYRRPA